MRRRFVAVLGTLGVVAVLAGCTSMPPGVDGNLTDAWPAMPVAKVSIPVAGVCYYMQSTGFSAGDDSTIPCSDPHGAETVYVGTFSGADADRSAVPAKGSQALVDTFGECRKNATSYLGDDFLTGVMSLNVVLPVAAAWKGGARWFRCDVTRFTDLKHSKIVGDGSAKDGLRGARPLAITCLIVTDDGKNTITDEQLIPCAQPHNAELTGLFTAPNVPWPSEDKSRSDMAQKGCEGVVAQYLGLSGGQVTNPVLGWGWDQFTRAAWEMGDRTIRCLVMAYKGNSVNNARFIGSVKGIGNAALKV